MISAEQQDLLCAHFLFSAAVRGTLHNNLSVNLFKLLHKCRPEDKQSKKERMRGEAEKKGGRRSTTGRYTK